jgi:hypothetical protein
MPIVFGFHFKDLNFDNLKNLAKFAAKRAGVDSLYLSIPEPKIETKKYKIAGTNNIDFYSIPASIAKQEIERSNGTVILSGTNSTWSLYLFKKSTSQGENWLIQLEFDVSKLSDAEIIELFLEFVTKLGDLYLGYGYDTKYGNFNHRYYSNYHGLWAGLRDVYWINFYGKEYVDLIGKEKLLNCDLLEKSGECAGGIYFVVLSACLKNRDAVITKIGDEYFVIDHKSTKFGVEERTGVFALFKTIGGLLKDNTENEIATKRPFM